jgi:nitrite reductase/ring-hydroxylating ferredoxin subunit
MRWEEGWYVLGESRQVDGRRLLPRLVLGRPLVVFRDLEGRAVALEDRCCHRHASLSRGRLVDGNVECPYHGWTYEPDGRLVCVPSEGLAPPDPKVRVRPVEVREEQGYVYARLERGRRGDPFPLPHAGEQGWRRLRFANRFAGSLVNCVENFLDAPHAAVLHRSLHWNSRRRELQEAEVVRGEGQVEIRYRGPGGRRPGLLSLLLHPSGRGIPHRDRFLLPNVTQVEYRLGDEQRLCITRQGVPLHGPGERPETLVYTDICWRQDLWSRLWTPFLRLQTLAATLQDLRAMADQGRQLERLPPTFRHTEGDSHHLMVESLVRELEAGRDPMALPERRLRMRFWV